MTAFRPFRPDLDEPGPRALGPAPGWTARHPLATGLLSLTVLITLALTLQPSWRLRAENQLLGWLVDRQLQAEGLALDPEAANRATALDPDDLPRDQARLADWLSRKYRIAEEPLGALVSEAYDTGKRLSLEPTLLLAIMAIESRFNPFAGSPVGAQGLMQVRTEFHAEKYDGFGGSMAAFDPVTNLRVGALVLQQTVRRAGTLEGGLRLYAGAVSTDGSGYIRKVLTEKQRLDQVARGVKVAFFQAHNPKTPSKSTVKPAAASTETEAALQPSPALSSAS